MPVRRLQKTAAPSDRVAKKEKPMTVVVLAFLQNPWFRKGISQRHVDMYRENPDFHRRLLAMSNTGRALIRALGEKLYARIIWDNANPRHGNERSAQFPPDSIHMAHQVALHDPHVVLLFGKQAIAGWDVVMSFKDLEGLKIGRVVLRSAHPMARGSATDHLREIATDVKRLVK